MVPLHLTLSITCKAGTNKGRGRGGEKDKRGKGTEVSFALSLIPLIFSLPPDPIPLLMPAHVRNHRHLYCGEFNYSTAFSQVILSNGMRLLIWWAHQMSHLGLCSWMWLRKIIILCGIAPLHNLWSPAILKTAMCILSTDCERVVKVSTQESWLLIKGPFTSSVKSGNKSESVTLRQLLSWTCIWCSVDKICYSPHQVKNKINNHFYCPK